MLDVVDGTNYMNDSIWMNIVLNKIKFPTIIARDAIP